MNRYLSGSCVGFTKFTIFSERPPEGYLWSEIQATTRPDHLWPEIWPRMSKAAQQKEKQQWAIEKPKFDNARKLRGIHFIDPDDKEFEEETLKTHGKVDNSNGSRYAL